MCVCNYWYYVNSPRFGFGMQDYWGFVTHSGTDGNMHGLYFAAQMCKSQCAAAQHPVVYVSEQAHYSVKKLAVMMGLDLRIILCDVQGCILPSHFEEQLDITRPVIFISVVGSTFKGAVDDQQAINAIIDRHKSTIPFVYRHADAALFGALLVYNADESARNLVNVSLQKFDSIALSGHKFWGFDDPCGLFICTKAVRDNLNPEHVNYLKDAIPTITCSRSALAPLKFWFKVNTTTPDQFRAMAAVCVRRAQELHSALCRHGIRAFVSNKHSNTVFFEQPSDDVMDKYHLAPDDCRYLGSLAHLIVMQHVSTEILDGFISDFVADKKQKEKKPTNVKNKL